MGESPPIPILRMRGIRKAFPGAQALDGVDLDAYPGHVTAVVGENGAGKSTLMKILAGVHGADAGEIYLHGSLVTINSPGAARELGISIIYQERNLVGSLSIAENLYLGNLPKRPNRAGWLDWQTLRRDTEEMLARLGMDLSPMAQVKGLSPADQQMTEIAKALTASARILIMDEPTSALTDRETNTLFEIIARLQQEQVAIIFISHRLEEVMAIADRAVVLRDGACVGVLRKGEMDSEVIVDLMVGRTLDDLYPRARGVEREQREIILDVRNLCSDTLNDISFQLREGEILGLGGLVGAGRTETARALFGVDRVDNGRVFVDGQEVDIRTPAHAIRHGMGYVTEDRHKEGLLQASTVKTNIALAVLSRLRHLLGWIQDSEDEAIAKSFVERLSVATTNIRQRVTGLSGGNQQKVILARWLATSPRILLLDEPTKGIDVGAKAEIHRIMDTLARQGLSIILISSEMPELLAMCDRVLVLRSGRIVAEYEHDEVTQEKVLRSAMGQNERADAI